MVKASAGSILVGAIEGLSLTKAEENLFTSGCLAGLTLFKRNIPPSFLELSKLNQEIQRLNRAGQPSFVIAIDQEGGRVARLKSPFPDQGPAEFLVEGYQDRDDLWLENYGMMVGGSLKVLGINVNFAPVVDILANEENPSIGDRVFGRTPELVAGRAGAYLKGLQQGGVQGCLKHFPGQGDAKVDTHEGTAIITAAIELLEKREFAPFENLLATSPMIMISHSVYSALDDKPASLSEKIMKGLLRERMGFSGVIVSDDMNMGALPQDLQLWSEAIVEAVAAGADMVLVCQHLEKCQLAHEALVKAAQSSKVFLARLEEAAARMTKLRRSLL